MFRVDDHAIHLFGILPQQKWYSEGYMQQYLSHLILSDSFSLKSYIICSQDTRMQAFLKNLRYFDC